jgi:hypothetical protein
MDIGELKEIAKIIIDKSFTDAGSLPELCAKDVVARHTFGTEFKGIDTLVSLMKNFPSNARVIVDDCFGEGDSVAVRFRVFFSLGGYEKVRYEIAILRFEGGKMAEIWGAYDRLDERQRKTKRQQ